MLGGCGTTIGLLVASLGVGFVAVGPVAVGGGPVARRAGLDAVSRSTTAIVTRAQAISQRPVTQNAGVLARHPGRAVLDTRRPLSSASRTVARIRFGVALHSSVIALVGDLVPLLSDDVHLLRQLIATCSQPLQPGPIPLRLLLQGVQLLFSLAQGLGAGQQLLLTRAGTTRELAHRRNLATPSPATRTHPHEGRRAR